MKSIKSKLIVFLGLLIGVICIGLGSVSFISSSKALTSNIGKTLPKLAEESASNIEGRIEGNLKTLEVIATRQDIRDTQNSWESKELILLEEVKRNGSIKMGIADKNGDVKYTDGKSANVKERLYFQKALAGESHIEDPLVSKVDGTIVVIFATPIKINNEIIGALIEVSDGNRLSELTSNIKFGETGNGFMIKKDGTFIAHSDNNLVMNMYNTIEESKKDPKLQKLADIQKKMGLGEIGIGKYQFEGIHKYIGYAPVKGTEWSVGIVVSTNEILSELNGLKISFAVSSILFLLMGLSMVYVISESISKGIKSTSIHLDLLAKGDLSKDVPSKYLNLEDEVGAMTYSMKVMQQSLKNMINGIKDSSSNINIQSENLSAVAEEISSSSQNVAEAINQIAGGTSSQSEDLINVTEVLNEFSHKLSEVVNEMDVLDTSARGISSMANNSSGSMNELNNSVTNVTSSFNTFNRKIIELGKDINEINDITNIINNIAKQTNLLALNAAIEAARAGESGKGFSVVADEIRKLAEQSKISSERISILISEISNNADTIVLDSVNMDDELINQVKIINNSIMSYKDIIEAINEVIPKIETVKNSTKDIDKDKDNILRRIDTVSSVSLEVSASSEEIAASSEETNAATEEVAQSAQMLSNMTNKMLEEVNKFKI
ncbi:methyl-accepting chemotaxis protein McpB [Clostridium putrefaciens]|uniref:Methyl-accepting chemotaxis protein McpB n=1 Tax=Clostridium putrefaciens TaxID=99675 RepID=A0A381JAR3_9CLOT|nr:methyl-accepting chemotaxis protein [Clostridium putrefaciens]SUY48089.1 methyl-accepting chemotaxis protein McpB [Clostridium putrefaciens]